MSKGNGAGAPSLTRDGMGIRDGLPLEIADDSPEALRASVQLLLDIEGIKRTKHAYFRCIDTGNFEELATLFHPEVKVHFKGGTYEWKLEGRDEYVDSVKQSFHSRSVGHHNAHHPEIDLLSATEATGIWYLTDNMWIMNFKNFTTGTALYWDRYEKVDGRWLIKDTRYERIYELNERLGSDPDFDYHYLGMYGAKLHE
ncbi:MAG: nuclear transport factor 2 family protein [bacterium]